MKWYTATEMFGLNEIARVEIDDTWWVLYSDTVHADAVPAENYDDVDPEYGAWTVLPVDGDTYGIWAADADEDADPIETAQGEDIDYLDERTAEHNAKRYSLWCASIAADRDTLAQILAAADIDHVNSGAHGHVERADPTGDTTMTRYLCTDTTCPDEIEIEAATAEEAAAQASPSTDRLRRVEK